MTDYLDPHAPHIKDGPGAEEVEELSEQEMGEEVEDSETTKQGVDWLRRAQDAYKSSTSYFDANIRKKVEDSLKMFNSEHTSDSKYSNPAYDKRSKIFRPKIRSVIRKNEAAGAVAFFSNMEVVNITPQNQGDQKQRIAADVMKQLVEYRLTSKNPKHCVPWFKIVLGGLQDAQVSCVCARVEWLYDEGRGDDRPEVELFPIENLRLDPASNWMDPVNSSPYLIHEFPMWVGDVKTRMETKDKTGRSWKKLSDERIRSATKQDGQSTRQARTQYGQDAVNALSNPISDYEVVWIQRHIHRHEGCDYHFYTLSDLEILSEVEKLEDVVFHGERPYVVGSFVLETHKPYPNPLPIISKGLTEEGNEIANQRLDNVKFVLNKGWIVRRNGNVDIASLVRNVPGRVTMADNPKEDVVEQNWPDVTSSAYEEQNRINQDMDELLGNFRPLNVPNRKGAETVKGMSLLEKPSSILTEYGLRTYVETFVEPVLRLIVLCEQHYETDEVLLELCGQKAQIVKKFGQQPNYEEMFQQDLMVKVNLGMGATDPSTKLTKLVTGFTAGANIQKLLQGTGANTGEIWKEICAFMGYQDGQRFFEEDPEKKLLQTQLQQMMKLVHLANQKLKEKEGANKAKIQTAQIKEIGSMARERLKQGEENKRLFAEIYHDRTMPEPEKEPNVAGG